ncbi:MAG: hrcA [Clostridiales bacterium]|jgi:heat-inducible transcriptional repressor|nr:hrcA [Clostridiales bacterium]
MELDERKVKILQAIINNYLETGEPVGSRTISKYTDMGISSATIRNEMADLEELGLIVQPHTSSGRVPSDKGYRIYVDRLMKESKMDDPVFKEDLLTKVDKIDTLLQNIIKKLANNTNYATVVSTPQYQQTKLKHIKLIKLSEVKLVAVIVIEGDIVKNHIINITEEIDEERVEKINNLLNLNLTGLSLVDINLALIQSLKEQVGIYPDLLNSVLDAICETIQSSDEIQLYTSGATNILKYPDFSDIDKAVDILYTLEEKNILQELLLTTDTQYSKDIKIRIGNENSVEAMQECSVLTATYKLGDGLVGTIGIIGPKRMNYEKAVVNLKQAMFQMNEIFNNQLQITIKDNK